MSTEAVDMLETAEHPAVQRVYDYCNGDAEKPTSTQWLQMLAETTGIVVRVSAYELSWDGHSDVVVNSMDYVDEHDPESMYIQSLLDYYEPEPALSKTSA